MIEARPTLKLVRSAIAVAALFVGGCDDDSVDMPTIEYVVGFNLAATSGPVGALQIEVDYLGTNGGWEGAGGSVACRWIVNASLHACNDKQSGALSCAIVDTSGFTGPTRLMECTFLSTDATVSAADFDVQVVDASGPDLAPIDARVTVTVATRPPDTTTTTDPDNPSVEYDVTFAIDEPVGATITALELEITHSGARGGWIGSGSNVDCRWLVALNGSLCIESSNEFLDCTAGDSVGFAAAGPILVCGFASPDPVVVTGDFDVRVVKATSPDIFPPHVVVLASSVTPR